MNDYHPFEVSDVRQKLLWQYGPERTQAILAGLDEATNLDIESWRSIGGKPYAGSTLDLARNLISQGESVEEAAQLTGCTLMVLRNSIRQRPL